MVLTGQLNSQGMLFDFGPAKKQIKRIIDTQADHKLILAQADKRLQWQQNENEVALSYTDDRGHVLNLRCPPQAFCLLPGESADRANVKHLLETEITAAMPDNVDGVEITLRQEVIPGATYAYCHGLKKHDGNCQRIAHGHRSRIEIFADGERSPAHEVHMAAQWHDTYLGSREDLQSTEDAPRYVFAYHADQGQFEIELDAKRCVLIDADSTVENIAVHIAKQLKQAEPHVEFKIQAYEGVNKGAIAQL